MLFYRILGTVDVACSPRSQHCDRPIFTHFLYFGFAAKLCSLVNNSMRRRVNTINSFLSLLHNRPMLSSPVIQLSKGAVFNVSSIRDYINDFTLSVCKWGYIGNNLKFVLQSLIVITILLCIANLNAKMLLYL